MPGGTNNFSSTPTIPDGCRPRQDRHHDPAVLLHLIFYAVLAVMQLAALVAAPQAYSRYRTPWMLACRGARVAGFLIVALEARGAQPGWQRMMAYHRSPEMGPLRGAIALLSSFSGE